MATFKHISSKTRTRSRRAVPASAHDEFSTESRNLALLPIDSFPIQQGDHKSDHGKDQEDDPSGLYIPGGDGPEQGRADRNGKGEKQSEQIAGLRKHIRRQARHDHGAHLRVDLS